MRRIHERLLENDIHVCKQDYDTPEHCKRAAKLMEKCVHGSEIHIRRKTKLVVVTEFAADSFVLQCLGLLDYCYKENLKRPEWLLKIANAAAACSRKRVLGFRPLLGGVEVGCLDIYNSFFAKLNYAIHHGQDVYEN